MDKNAPIKVLIAISAFLVFLVFVSPFTAPSGSALGLDGVAGFINHWNLWSEYDIFSGFSYLLGDIFCHQQEARSFILNGNQMPVCVRDVFILIGFLITLLIILKLKKIEINLLLFGAVLMIPMFMDWITQYMLVLNFRPTIIITGLLAGIGMGMIAKHASDSIFDSIVEK